MSTNPSRFDAIVLGAGINGCGIARELSLKNRRVLVLDKASIGGGTSSKSSRLIHGGLRYLETMQLSLVREALADRRELIHLYPDLVHLKPFYFPIYNKNPRPAWIIWSGLKVYDFLAGMYTSHRSEIITRKRFLNLAPCLSNQGLKTVFRFHDAKTNDCDLTIRVAEDAINRGSIFKENARIDSIKFTESHITVSAGDHTWISPILINATGPWIDETNARFAFPARYHIRKISGIHLIVNGLLTEDILLLQTQGKRLFFIIPEPEHDHTLIGTTEREEHLSVDDVKVDDQDIQYLLQNLNAYLRPDCQLKYGDIRDTFIGIRPLIAHKEDPTNLSREYKLDLHCIGQTKLLHIFGGKLTTYLSLSRKAVGLLGA